jgi:hypothetical protein
MRVRPLIQPHKGARVMVSGQLRDARETDDTVQSLLGAPGLFTGPALLIVTLRSEAILGNPA